jgi:hypothetical protein
MISRLIENLLGDLVAKQRADTTLSPAFRNLDLTKRAPTTPTQQQTPGVQVMDASQVKTMKKGGSVVIGKGKDYIKDLL